jgi:acyl-[acyl carrier protein]--UDP-N-acetylglucosamine O-acyltransferase
VTVQGYPAKPHGINTEGLRRRGFSSTDILTIRRAYKTLYREGLALDDAKAVLGRGAIASPVLAPLVAFLADSGRESPADPGRGTRCARRPLPRRRDHRHRRRRAFR